MGAIRSISQAVNVVFYGVSLFGFAGTLNIVQIASFFVLRPFSERYLIKLNSRLVGSIWKVMQFVFERRKKAYITFSGDQIPFNENALVISNHLSWTDFYLIHSVANRRGMLPNLKYFVKDSIKYLPFFGWGMWLANFIYVRRDWTQDEKKIHETFSHFKRLETPAWIINYVEGSRLTIKKLYEAQNFARKRGYPVLDNLLLPRTRGFVSCVNEFRDSHIKYVYDFTLVYRNRKEPKKFHQSPNMIRVHMENLWPDYKFHVHCRRFLIEDLPKDELELSNWLRNRWAEKDALINTLKSQWLDGLNRDVIWHETSF